MNSLKLPVTVNRLWYWLAGGAVLLIILFFAGEYLYDRIGEIIFDRNTARRNAKDIELEKKFKELEVKYQIQRAKLDEQAKLLEKSDEAKTEEGAKALDDEKKALAEKFKEIEDTPPDKQLEELCKETDVDWDFCK